MGKATEDLLKRALSLDVENRGALAGALIDSLDSDTDIDARTAWDAEIRRRVAELESNAVDTVPWSAVREQLFLGFE